MPAAPSGRNPSPGETASLISLLLHPPPARCSLPFVALHSTVLPPAAPLLHTRSLHGTPPQFKHTVAGPAAAAALVSPYARNLPRWPEITNIYMTSGVDVPVDTQDWGLLGAEQDVVHLGGEHTLFHCK